MIGIEFLKVFKRKFNYIYILISLLSLIAVYYTKNTYYSDVDISKQEFFYNYFMKLIAILTFLFTIVNVILSYRKDYRERIHRLITYSKITKFYNLLVKIMVNYFLASIYYFLLLGIVALILYLSGNISILTIDSLKNNLIITLVLLLFVTNISILMVVIFNNSSVSIATSILLLTFVTFIREFIKGEYNVQLAGDIFADTFAKITHYSVVDSAILIQVAIYSVCLFFISLIVKLIKNN